MRRQIQLLIKKPHHDYGRQRDGGEYGLLTIHADLALLEFKGRFVVIANE